MWYRAQCDRLTVIAGLACTLHCFVLVPSQFFGIFVLTLVVLIRVAWAVEGLSVCSSLLLSSYSGFSVVALCYETGCCSRVLPLFLGKVAQLFAAQRPG